MFQTVTKSYTCKEFVWVRSHRTDIEPARDESREWDERRPRGFRGVSLSRRFLLLYLGLVRYALIYLSDDRCKETVRKKRGK
ncbi:Uncharacterised protein [Porphyromonas cangingivalis]|nr:Uncharacterised protein [Porphyromonas cangingivalis]VEJ03014.1 Uncharacterised protein [Porphyromonas cangingivalis]